MTYKVVTEATVGPEQHVAKMDLVITPGDAAENGERKTKIEWQKLELDGNEMDMAQIWQATIGKDGILREAIDPKDDEYRRFLSVYSFGYPDKAIKVGDKWSVEVSPKSAGAKKMKYDFEAKEISKVGDKDAMKIESTQKEEGENGLKSDGTWWIGKDGAVLKFKLDVKNWIVPFAGNGPIDAKITGDPK
jgi:hypothetical protein